ncbi:MAG TPA: hypothetical protein VLM79_13135 [Kofleriaceae bacterium]|nr:hypothetical protein [Kofleriaceae bacterium]
MMAMLVVASCRAADPSEDPGQAVALPAFPEAQGPFGFDPPRDAGMPPDATPPTDGSPPIDAPPSTPPPDLTQICGAQPVTLDDWEDCYRKRFCDAMVGCSSGNPFLDVDECVARIDDLTSGRLEAERRERKRAVDQGRASLNAGRFEQCLRDLSHASCNADASRGLDCAMRFDGTVDDNATCNNDIDCRSPGATCAAGCSSADACCLGTCQPRRRMGQSCSFSSDCEPGFECHDTCVSGDSGTPCASDDHCDPGAWCNSGRCADDLAPDAPCHRATQCGGETTCVGLSVIDSRPGKCLRISHAGDHCDDLCFGNLYCDASGTCRDLPTVAQSCTASGSCRGIDTFCNAGQCALLGILGATCTNSGACRRGSFCSSELGTSPATCVPPGNPGQSCTAPDHCESFLCSGSTGRLGACNAWSDTCPSGGF